MSSTNIRRSKLRLDECTFRLLDLATTNGHCVVQATADPKSSIRWNPDNPTDPQFNLSAIIGNDNASFRWGRSGFEKMGRDFKVGEEQGTGACILTGQLLNLAGEYKDASINLDERLKIEEYVDVGSNETYHRVVCKEHPVPERTLILCFDGTSNHFSDKNTNVVKLVELLKKDDPSKQMVYYQTGVGTYSSPGLTTSAGLAIASKLDEAVAWYLYQHVIDGYRYLMETYRIGDRIALFGFSRGAFTARALAGMLHCVGLLPRHNAEHIPFAYEVYKNANDRMDAPSGPTSASANPTKAKNVDPEEFKRTFCVPIMIDYVGVWDTVASVGALMPQSLPWIDYNPSVLTFRQALALDERRGNFIPSVWDHRRTTIVQDIKEVWFKGEHSDVGGGSAGPENDNYSMLSNISLRWMIRQILECRVGILFDHLAIELYRRRQVLETPPAEGLRPSKDWMKRLAESRKLDHGDIQKGIYDSIGRSILWNGLEYFAFTAKPTKNDKCEPITSRWPHAKAGRQIFRCNAKDPIYLHSSVVDQLAAYGSRVHRKEYKPRAKWYGYEAHAWPRIEDVSIIKVQGGEHPEPGDMLPEETKSRLQIVRPAGSRKLFGIF
ncbi:putative protein YEL023C [Saccharomyces cerevisiae S288c] [Rhizoctonia solani]|uniref:DUF2235 domain-containing protein n=1 Tax=Rhizoctonia solani TaxID=456999 RepID=A0A0K6G3Q3_9AGAM|nr:putative protein YEL023C [Saccharomyces cerevisiae S288c] [Rhizoctonia solani]